MDDLERRLLLVESKVDHLSKVVDGNGDSLFTKFNRILDRHTEESDRRLRVLENKVETLNTDVKLISTNLANVYTNFNEFKNDCEKENDERKKLNIQLLVLLATTLLNLILGSIKVFGGG